MTCRNTYHRSYGVMPLYILLAIARAAAWLKTWLNLSGINCTLIATSAFMHACLLASFKVNMKSGITQNPASNAKKCRMSNNMEIVLEREYLLTSSCIYLGVVEDSGFL